MCQKPSHKIGFYFRTEGKEPKKDPWPKGAMKGKEEVHI